MYDMPEEMDARSGDSRVTRFTKIAGRVLLGLILIAVAIYPFPWWGW